MKSATVAIPCQSGQRGHRELIAAFLVLEIRAKSAVAVIDYLFTVQPRPFRRLQFPRSSPN
jgi:hypothetical protein